MTRSLRRKDNRTLGRVLASGRSRLASTDLEGAALDARVLLGHVTGFSHEQMIVEDQRELDEETLSRFDTLVDRRVAREPVAYLIGHKEFFGLKFKVTSDTLIPRPDTEVLVETALAYCLGLAHPPRILDLGTGSGAILLALLHGRREASGVGVDSSHGSLEVANCNAVNLGLAGRAEFVRGDWTKEVTGTFDVIVTNPPYITSGDMANLMPDVANFEPAGALDGGADGLDPMRTIARDVTRLFARPGLFCAEIGLGQAEAAKAILLQAGLQNVECVPDLNGIPRCMVAMPPT